jgi:putative ATP-binding cassette transporter
VQLLRELLARFRWPLALALSGSAISGFGTAALISTINNALRASAAELTQLGWRFAALGIVVLLSRMLSQTVFMRLGQRVKADLRVLVTRRIADAPYRHIEQQGSGKGLAVLTADLDAVVMLFVGLPSLVMQGAVVAGCLFYLGYLSWQILLAAIVTILLSSLGFHLAHRRALAYLRSSRRREDDLMRHFRALFDGAKELKLRRARKEAFLSQVLGPDIEAVRAERSKGYVLYAAAASWGSFVFFAFIGIVLFVLSGFLNIEPYIMSAYAMTFLYMLLPIEAALSAVPSVNNARVALENIEALARQLPSEPAPAAHIPPATLGVIALTGVRHHYFNEKENGTFELGPIDMTLRAGELAFLIGGNGSGKTTLAKLVAGLYAPESGAVSLNDLRIEDGNRAEYREHFAAVFGDFHLFDRLLGFPTHAAERAAPLLQRLQLSHKVTIMDGRFSTTELSQGQRKRLALLVAYLDDRPFYIFDEWAADQDPVFKRVFYEELLPELRTRGKGVLVISHDDRYFHVADRYIKLEDGKLADVREQVLEHQA